jgi:hypothetical protein
VEGAEAVDGRVDQSPGGLGVGDVGDDGEGLAGHGLGRRIERILVAGAHDDLGALLAEGHGGGAAEALGGGGHQGDLALEA